MRQLTAAEAADRARLLTVTAYDVDLDLTTGAETFGSRTTIHFRCAEPGASSFAELVAPTVREVTLNGRPVEVTGGRIPLTDLAAENVLTAVAECAYSRTGEGLHRFTDPADGLVYTYSQTFLYEAQRVFACFDQPDLKAPWRLSVTAPPEWTVVLSNAATEQVSPGRWEAAETPPLATYFMAVVAGPYHSVRRPHGELDLGLHCRQSLAAALDADELFGVTASCLGFFTELFGMAYPFGPTYDQVFVPEFNAGAMENPGCVTFRDEFLFRSRVTDDRRAERAEVVAHEMAHMWFGDLVSMRWWDDLWLNESFADHLGRLAVSRATRWTDIFVAFVAGREAWGYRQDQLPTTHPVSAEVADTDAALLNFDGISYAKGASVLGQLVAWVGEDAFFAAVREYFRAHAYGNTTLADLLAALERASGRDLTEWSRLWLQTAGVNTLHPEVELAADGTYASVAVRQSAPAAHPVLRPHRIAIGLYDAEGIRRERIELDIVGERTEVPALTGHPAAALLLLNDDDLTYAKIRFDARSLQTVLTGIAGLESTVARALCWSALWDMTRDAELPAEVFADAVLTGLRHEPDISVVQRLLAHARSAVDSFLPPDVRPAVLKRLADGSRELLEAARPGGEAQVAFAYAYAGWVAGDELRDWLDGRGVPDGLAVDADLRWTVLRRLAALGHADEADIAAEEARDGTSKGRLAAATARAVRPTAAAKREAWRLAVEDEAASAHLVDATVAGFWQPEQVDLLRPYAERYFALVPALWHDRGPQVSLTLAQGLYPLALADDETVARSAAGLADEGLHPAARRILLEQTDHLHRVRAARAAARG